MSARRLFKYLPLFSVLVCITLGGCLVSHGSMLNDQNTDLPFGEYSLFRQILTNSDTQQPEQGGRVALRRSGAGYVMETVDKGAMAQYNGTYVLAKEIYSTENFRLFVLQAKFSDSDNDSKPTWMYLSLRYNPKTKAVFIKDYTEVGDCGAIPDELLAKLRPVSEVGLGCSISDLGGLEQLIISDFNTNLLTDKGYNLRLVSSS